ncbi:ATP-binding protein [Bacillus sp. SJS]|uniref:ATP-binding protein n=1 Tax=Bacillus sp. SJS TaxID=1423321 RepID=UPI0004DCC244|nr:ATP-binding protein [Bacillus sp. SJS]KZZ84028.1 PAS domain-containing sensor histidine kinase [Bacillus sp. SJS]
MEPSRKIAFRIAIIYLIIGVLWIFATDYASLLIAKQDLKLYNFFQHYKGWIFILATSAGLYLLVYSRTKRILHSKEKLEQKEKELERSNEHYRSLFHHNPDGVFEADSQGKLMALNPEGELIIGYKESYIKGRDALEFVIPSEWEMATALFRKVIAGHPQKFELTVRNRLKQKRILRCSLLPIVVDGEIQGVFGIGRDITEFKANEELMITTEKMSIIGELAASVAHEIRNPLTSLKGFVQLMSSTRKLDDQHLDIMMSEIDRINLISGEMLALGKRQDVVFRKENLLSIMSHVMVLIEGEANMKNVMIQLEDESMDMMHIYCDQNQLKQVFLNLLKNAIEAIDDSGLIKIKLSSNGAAAMVRIEDDGAGMEEERLAKLGEPFYSTKEKGTGLGLAVCFSIVKRHKGSIRFASTVGKGTTVEVEVPLAK